MQCVQMLGKRFKNESSFGSILADLDKRVISFTHQDSLAPTRVVHFRKGVSFLISSNSKSSTQAHVSTGLLSGSIEGWKMLPLLFQITLSLNMTPHLLPTQNNWLNTNCGNIMGSVMKSLNVVLILSFFINSKSLTETNIINLRQLGKSAVLLMHKLKKLKTILLNKCTINQDKIQEFTVFTGIKFHLLEHLFAMLPYYGSCGRAFDTQVSESSHKVTVKKTF